ncbi:MAG: hypothetical protein ABSH22_22445 [Tepidisphaeraceae bacterium]|jgi:hypothetical protein
MKHIVHILFFIAGAGVGIWWGVDHPTQAQKVATTEETDTAKIEAAVAQAKIELLSKFTSYSSTQPSDQAQFKQMLSDEKVKLSDATSKLGNAIGN